MVLEATTIPCRGRSQVASVLCLSFSLIMPTMSNPSLGDWPIDCHSNHNFIGADVAKQAQRGLRLAKDLPKTKPNARPNPAARAGTFCRGYDGASCRSVGRGAGTNGGGLFLAPPSMSCQ